VLVLRITAQILVSVPAVYDDFEIIEYPVDVCSLHGNKTGEKSGIK
jgi:hypothetical protein